MWNRLLFLPPLALLTTGCDGPGVDSASAGPQSLADRLTNTTWACQWISLNAPLNEYPSASSRVEVDHTLSFTATTMTDDLPERLSDWGTSAPDTYARDVAYCSGFNALGTADVLYTMDEVNWTAVSDEQLLFSLHDTQGRWAGSVATTVRWDGDGMWMEMRLFGWSNYSRCSRTSPPADETGA